MSKIQKFINNLIIYEKLYIKTIYFTKCQSIHLKRLILKNNIIQFNLNKNCKKNWMKAI